MMINKNLIKKISEKTKLDLLLIKQMPVKLYLERPVHYLCKDLKTNKEYLLAVAYTDAQICRLKKVDDNSKLFIKEWSDYFLFNPLLASGYLEKDKIYFVLFEYFNYSKRLESSSDFLKNTFTRIMNEKSYIQKVDSQMIDKLLDKFIEQRCPQDNLTMDLLKSSQEYVDLKQAFESYNEIRLVNSKCNAQPANILVKDNKKYLIGLEYGGIDLPVGFDLYCIKKYTHDKNITDIPYLDLNEALYKIQFVGNSAYWLKFHNPIVKLDKGRQFIKILEAGKFTTIDIKQRFPLYKFDLIIDFKNVDISPLGAFKLVKLIEKKFDDKYIVRFKNCPYWFDRLKQDEENVLSFSGVINKDYEEPKDFMEYIKSTQAYVNYSKIMPYVKPYWFRALLAVLICIPIGSLDAVIALSLKPYMDLVMVDKSVQSPMYIPFAIVAFTTLQGFLNYMATYMNTWVGTKITNDLKFDLYKKMLTLETAFFDKKKSGDIVFRFNNDADAACAGLLDNLKTFVSRLFSSISLVGVLFYNSW